MHYISLYDALANGKPTVACFGTPLLCASQLCGPTLDEQILAFQDGASFEEALRVADSRGEGEVVRIKDMYIDKGCAKDLVFVGPGDEVHAIPVWDTHGYWRLLLSD